MGNCLTSSSRVDSAQSAADPSRGKTRTDLSFPSTRTTSTTPSTFIMPSYSGKSTGESLPTPRTEGEILSSSNLKAFAFNELKSATRNFRPDSLLGEGGFGYVFKGWIDEENLTATKPGSGMVIAVKRLKPEGFQGHKEWLTEVQYLGQLHHPNLVELYGYCAEGDNRLLVYEFMPKGSLENHLFRNTLTEGSKDDECVTPPEPVSSPQTLNKEVGSHSEPSRTLPLDISHPEPGEEVECPLRAPKALSHAALSPENGPEDSCGTQPLEDVSGGTVAMSGDSGGDTELLGPAEYEDLDMTDVSYWPALLNSGPDPERSNRVKVQELKELKTQLAVLQAEADTTSTKITKAKSWQKATTSIRQDRAARATILRGLATHLDRLVAADDQQLKSLDIELSSLAMQERAIRQGMVALDTRIKLMEAEPRDEKSLEKSA